MITPGQLSVAVTAYVTGAVQEPTAVVVTIFTGQVITGACVSFTLTVKVQVAVLPAPSVAVLVTVVVPTGKKLPLAGTDTVPLPGTGTVPTALNKICMFGKPIAAVVVGTFTPQAVADK